MARTVSPKYTPERIKRLTEAISLGSTRKLAAQYAGIDEDTLRAWEKRYPEFKASLREAEGRAVVGWLAKIEKAANDGTWQAAAWKLERLHAEDYGRTVSEQRHSGPDGKSPVVIQHIEVVAPTEAHGVLDLSGDS
jgi:hypothetical protein